jgi:transketolase
MPLGDLAQKYRAFGWHAIAVNGHDYAALMNALEEAKRMKGRPTMIVAETTPGKGVSFIENKYQWHGMPPKPDEGQKALAELAEERIRIMQEAQ